MRQEYEPKQELKPPSSSLATTWSTLTPKWTAQFNSHSSTCPFQSHHLGYLAKEPHNHNKPPITPPNIAYTTPYLIPTTFPQRITALYHYQLFPAKAADNNHTSAPQTTVSIYNSRLHTSHILPTFPWSMTVLICLHLYSSKVSSNL